MSGEEVEQAKGGGEGGGPPCAHSPCPPFPTLISLSPPRAPGFLRHPDFSVSVSPLSFPVEACHETKQVEKGSE